MYEGPTVGKAVKGGTDVVFVLHPVFKKGRLERRLRGSLADLFCSC